MLIPLSLVGLNVTPPREGLRATAHNCAVICLPIETIEFLVFAPSDARERSYIVHISLQPSSGLSLPARHSATRLLSQLTVFLTN